MILSRRGEQPAVVRESTAACYGIMVLYASHNISLGHAHQQQSSGEWLLVGDVVTVIKADRFGGGRGGPEVLLTCALQVQGTTHKYNVQGTRYKA